MPQVQKGTYQLKFAKKPQKPTRCQKQYKKFLKKIVYSMEYGGYDQQEPITLKGRCNKQKIK